LASRNANLSSGEVTPARVTVEEAVANIDVSRAHGSAVPAHRIYNHVPSSWHILHYNDEEKDAAAAAEVVEEEAEAEAEVVVVEEAEAE